MQHDAHGTSFPRPPGSFRSWLVAVVARLAAAPAMSLRTLASSRTQAPPAEADRPMFSGLRVLVADDDPAHVAEAGELLRHFGITPMLAADGAEAVALACGHEFDLILMDLQMPVLDGLAATRQIRRFENEQSGARAAILAFTSHALKDDVMQRCGFDGVLEKPCTLRSLQDCLVLRFPE